MGFMTALAVEPEWGPTAAVVVVGAIWRDTLLNPGGGEEAVAGTQVGVEVTDKADMADTTDDVDDDADVDVSASAGGMAASHWLSTAVFGTSPCRWTLTACNSSCIST
jgi:hypothetical protein